MTDFESYIAEQLSHLIPNCENIEVRANISESSYSFEFFATINGKRMQCFDMIDEGLIKEKDFDICAKAIAQYARSTAGFKTGEVNKYTFTFSRV